MNQFWKEWISAPQSYTHTPCGRDPKQSICSSGWLVSLRNGAIMWLSVGFCRWWVGPAVASVPSEREPLSNLKSQPGFCWQDHWLHVLVEQAYEETLVIGGWVGNLDLGCQLLRRHRLGLRGWRDVTVLWEKKSRAGSGAAHPSGRRAGLWF